MFPRQPSSRDGVSRNVGNVNTSTILGATAALLLALAPQSSAAALTRSGSTGVAYPLPGGAAAPGRGNVTAVIPGASIAANDGIDQAMQRDRNYPTEFLVWVAPNAGKATLSLHAEGAVIRRCTSKRLRPATTSAVTCLVRGTAKTGHVSIDVVVRTRNFGTFSRTFVHELTN